MCIDDILNEYFLKAADILIEPLYILFNKILESRSFPAQWATGLVVPLPKKEVSMTQIIIAE